MNTVTRIIPGFLACLFVIHTTLAQQEERPSGPLKASFTPTPQLLGVPVGTILPYFGELSTVLPNNWQFCDGRVVRDPNSPFNGQRLPDLTDSVFIMGIPASSQVGQKGGNNNIPTDGNHNHSIRMTGYAPGEINYNRGPGRFDQYQMQYGSADAGNHSHGGENRPRYIGVYFIIRIK